MLVWCRYESAPWRVELHNLDGFNVGSFRSAETRRNDGYPHREPPEA